MEEDQPKTKEDDEDLTDECMKLLAGVITRATEKKTKMKKIEPK